MKDFGGTGAWEAIRNWGSIIQLKLRFIKKIDRVLLLIAKRYVEWGLGHYFHIPEKKYGEGIVLKCTPYSYNPDKS